MLAFSIQDVVALSGLSRGQVDQLISRWGFGVYGRSAPGRARQFHPADMFNFMLAGELYRLGLSMPRIRDTVVGDGGLGLIGLYAWDASTDSPAEIYPGQGSLSEVAGSFLISVYYWQGKFHAVPSTGAAARAPEGHAALVIDAAGLARRIIHAAKVERFQ